MKKNGLVFLFVLCCLFACRENTRVNMVSGTLYNTCESRLPNAEVALKADIGVDFGEPIILGTGKTDDQGRFSFTYELEEEDVGTADLLLINSNSFETLIEGLKLNVNQELVLYRANESTLFVKLNGSRVFGATDTLFYGITEVNLENNTVQASNGVVDTFKFQLTNKQIQSAFSTVFYYGVGSNEFQLSKEAVGIKDSSFQNIPLMLKACTKADSVLLIIN